MRTNDVLHLDNIVRRESRTATTAAGLSLSLSAGECQFMTVTPGSEAAFLLPIITGEARVLAGTGTLLGYPLVKMSASRRRRLLQQIGIISGPDVVIAKMTLGDFVALPLQIAGKSVVQVDAKVQSLLAELGLTLHTRNQMSALNPSQRRLASLAQAIIKTPRLILAELRDDKFDRQVILPILQRYAEHGGAVLVLVEATSAAGRHVTAPLSGSVADATI